MDEIPTCPEVAERHILLAVDASEASRRAVAFAAELFGAEGGHRFTLLHVVQRPAEAALGGEEEAAAWTEARAAEAEALLEGLRRLLVARGIAAERVSVAVEVIEVATVADAILAARGRLGACCIVVGRRPLSRQEEFLYGSTSSRLLHEAHGCAVLAVHA
ncbi:MAG: universal stress protein [Nitrospirae bacterium]|nr:MAG: universal stress protein [Nitrospirota bacterium]